MVFVSRKTASFTNMLIHAAWKIRDVEVGITLIGKFLELGVERLLLFISESSEMTYSQQEFRTLAKLTS